MLSNPSFIFFLLQLMPAKKAQEFYSNNGFPLDSDWNLAHFDYVSAYESIIFVGKFIIKYLLSKRTLKRSVRAGNMRQGKTKIVPVICSGRRFKEK